MEEAEVKEKFTFEKIIDSLEKCLPTEQVDAARGAVEQAAIAMKEGAEPEEQARVPMNREQRRRHAKQRKRREKDMYRFIQDLDKLTLHKAKDLSPEEKDIARRNLLKRVIEENEKFAEMRRQENERV